jgi:hypothetical protein
MNLKDLIVLSYKRSISFQDILLAFSKGHAQSLMLWQKYNEGRNVFWVRNWEVEHANERVVVFNENKKGISLDPLQPVYIKLPFREAILKTKIEVTAPYGYLLKIPSEIFWREFRESPRISFEPGERTAEVRPALIHSRTQGLINYKVYLRDISKHGMGILVSDANQALFKPGTMIELMSIDNGFMLSPKVGHVVYNVKEAKHDNLHGVWHRIGIKMIKAFPEDVLNKFKKQIESESLLNTVDCFSEDFKKIVEQEVEVTLKKIKNNPALAKFLTQLEISRNEDDYLEEHIKVLCMICTYIARSLNWVTDASSQKLIYVAYIHDAPLFQYPKLAKIHSLKQFNRIKHTLSDIEQKIYLSAPEKAYSIAQADSSAPPDAALMLLMQKELPNGEGFPRKFNMTKITPMAAVFIVAHDLTNEMMSSSDWSIEEWLKTAKLLYKGGAFTKIIDSLEKNKFSFKKKKLK